MRAKSHYHSLHGYALPVTIRALDHAGPPRALLQVTSEEQRGPLLVTLSHELACGVVALLYESLVDGIGTQELERECLKKGGKEYRDGVARESEFRVRVSELSRQLQRHEDRVLRLDHAKICDRRPESGVSSESPNGGFLEWVMPLNSEAAEARDRYEELLGELNRAKAEWKKCGQFVSQLRVKHAGDRAQLAHGVTIDFTSQSEVIQQGIAGILQRTDSNWWRRFEEAFQAEYLKASKGLLGLLLRDSALLAFVGRNEKLPLEQARAEFIRNSHAYGSLRWPTNIFSMGSLEEANLRQKRKVLRDEDKFAADWILTHCGSFHPCDWLNRGEIRPTDEPHLRAQYPPERAINELLWCTCRETRETFETIFSQSYSKGDWAAWLLHAQTGEPEYWKRP